MLRLGGGAIATHVCLLASTLLTTPIHAQESPHQKSLRLEPIGSYHTGATLPGASEIVGYHAPTAQLFSVNGKDHTIDIVSIANPKQPQLIRQVSVASYGNLPTSVSVREDLIATCLLGHTPRDRGQVVFLTPAGKIVGSTEVGFHPDMVMFSPNGHYLLVANEGEPSADGQQDGEGSVSVLTVPPLRQETLGNLVVRSADFRAWDERPLPEGVRRVEPQKPASQDFEPEGLAFSADSRKAYVTLQENSAVAVVDLADARVERLIGLGYKDHSAPGNELDTAGLGQPQQLRNCPVLGMYQPDNVAWFRAGGREYLILANEGDARGNELFQEEIVLSKAKLDSQTFPNAAELQAADQLGSLVVSTTGDLDGDGDLDQLLSFGGRSIAIVGTDGQWIYDSGCQIERLVADRITRQSKAEKKGSNATYRTKKGPEPEGLAIGQINDRTYVFVGLERDNGIVTFDVTDPQAVQVADYLHPADHAEHPADIAGDIGPEGLIFINGSMSPTGEPLLVVANEVSGSVTLYAVRSLGSTPAVARGS